MKNIFVYFFVIVVLYFGLNEVRNCYKNILIFRNYFFFSYSIFKVYCKFRNDDLGDYFVKFEGLVYNFSFYDNIIVFLKIKFDCNLWKGVNMEYY